VFGGYKTQGKGDDEKCILKDAKAVEDAGAFALVCEKMPDALARKITRKLTIPTIGIGASMYCDGQILVIDDMLGMFTDFKPKFVKRFANLGEKVNEMAAEYASEVRSRKFPTPDHVYDYAGEE
jgi:3-methyl-2-oxobutanoate hydroxymethyltransferase